MDRLTYRRAALRHVGNTFTPTAAALLEAELFAPGPDQSIDPSQFQPVEISGFRIAAERCRDCLAELKALQQHLPQFGYDDLLERERAGRVLQINARRDGELAGELRMFLFRSLHTQQLLAEDDMLFVAPQHRTAMRLPLELIRFAKRACIQLGVHEMHARIDCATGASALMQRLEVELHATLFIHHLEAL